MGQPCFQGTLGPRLPSQLPQGASFLSTLSPLKAPDEPPLHRLKSDRADWAWSNPLKPWTRHISWLLQVILTQQRKATKIVAQVPELTHRYSMTLLRTSAAFFFLSETYKMILKFEDLVLSQAKATLKDHNIGEHRFPHFKTFCEATVAKTVKKNRPMEQTSRSKACHWGKVITLDDSVGQLDRHMKRNRFRPGPHTTYKNSRNSKWIRDQNVCAEVIKHLEESTGINSTQHTNQRNIWSLGRRGSEKLTWLSAPPKRQCTKKVNKS